MHRRQTQQTGQAADGGDGVVAELPRGSQLAAREMWRRRGVTERVLAVWQLAASGMSGPAIGRELCISPRTVRKHLENLYRTLKIGSSQTLVALAWDSGLVAEMRVEALIEATAQACAEAK